MSTFKPDEKTADFFDRGFWQLERLNAQLTGALELLIVQNGLEGRWAYDPKTRMLHRQEQELRKAA